MRRYAMRTFTWHIAFLTTDGIVVFDDMFTICCVISYDNT